MIWISFLLTTVLRIGAGKYATAMRRGIPVVRVFHTENQGHYLARNFAIRKAREKGSKYIGFVDADDWIDSDMYETLVRIAEKENADIVECGYYWQHPVKSWSKRLPDRVMNSTEALCALFKNELDDYLWDKLWKITCFETDPFCYPERRSHQDAATVYKLFAAADKIVSTSAVIYHYQQIRESIVHTPGIGLLNQWYANIEKYEYAREHLKGKVDEAEYGQVMSRQVRNCAVAVAENWGYWHGFSWEDQRKYERVIADMHAFSQKHFPLLGRKNWPRFVRIMAFFSHFKNALSFYLAYQVARRRGRDKKLY